MKLSFTALRTFRDCSFRHHLRYNKGLPTRPRPLARISRALHGSLFKFHRAIKEQESPTLDTLLDFYKGYYQNPTRPLTDAQYVEGRKILTRYYDSRHGQFPTPYLLEEKFSLHVGPYVLNGRFDRVDEVGEGYEIIDYKLGGKNPLPPDPLQLDIYQLALYEQAGKEATALSFYYLRANKKMALVARRIIKEQAFQPHEGVWCTTCDYAEFCPAKKKRPKPVPVTQWAMQIPFDFG
jgi:RecB family exonuclease